MRLYRDTILPLLALCALLVTACSEDTPEEAPVTIPLSASEITLPKGAAVETVTMKMDESEMEDWDYMLTPEVDWLKVTRKGTDVVLSAQENNESQDRHTTVQLLLGHRTGKIQVTQSAADMTLSTNLKEINLSAMGGESVVRVESNSSTWAVRTEEGADWLSVSSVSEKGLLLITASRNTAQEERSAKVILGYEGKEEQQVTVTQAAPLVFFEPFKDDTKELVYRDLIDFEEGRGFVFTFMQIGSNDGFMGSPDVLSFKTTSDLLPQISYFRAVDYDNIYESARVTVETGEMPKEDHPFVQYLLAQGYTKRYDHHEDDVHLVSPDGYFSVRAAYSRQDDNFYFDFTPEYRQDGPLPTFETLPLGPEGMLDRVDNKEVKFPDIDKWETETLKSKQLFVQKAGTDPDRPDDVWMALYKTAEGTPEDMRWYTFYFSYPPRNINPGDKIQSVTDCKLVFRDKSKILFIIDKRTLKFKTTQEFADLLKANGYEYHGVVPSLGMRYQNAQKGMEVYVMLADFKGVVEGDDTVMAVLYYKKMTPATRSLISAAVPEEAAVATGVRASDTFLSNRH